MVLFSVEKHDPQLARRLRLTKSMKLFREAMEVIPGGVNSNARLWQTICPSDMPCSLFIKAAKGSLMWDVDGNRYIDYRLGYGPIILGHSFPEVEARVRRASEHGTVFAFSHELEITAAKKVLRMVPVGRRGGMLRFANTGTEATMHALRIARAWTGKDLVLKFEGHYHGAHDYLLWSTHPSEKNIGKARAFDQKPIAMSKGIPRGMEKFVLVERWNNFDAIEKTVRKHQNHLAAIITEPVMGNAGAITPREGYLKWLRTLCDRYNVALIFDEVKTGFRLANGGAQEVYGVTPDIATYSKSIGNGHPVAAIVGKKEAMGMIGPGGVTHGGTFAGNPVSLAAVDATLDILHRKNVIKHMHNFGYHLSRGMHQILERSGMGFSMQGHPTMFQYVFAGGQIWEFRDLFRCDLALYSRLQIELLKRGVMFDEDNQECIYTCYSHSKKDLGETLEKFEDAIKAVR